jgi:REP element-mobilizing transposase RayT
MLNKKPSRIVRWYKGRTTFEVRKIHADFAWQTRFHDHIIRNETDYQNSQATQEQIDELAKEAESGWWE